MANGRDIFQPGPQQQDPFARPDISALLGRITPTEKIGYLERPGRFISELIQGGDPMRALLRGRATKPSLGYALFPEGEKKGFQAEDVAAFGVDVVADPLTYLLPPLIGKVGKMLKAGSKLGMTAFYGDQVKDIVGKLNANKLKIGDVKAYAKMRARLKKLVLDKKITGEEQRDIALSAGVKLENLGKGMVQRLGRRQQNLKDLKAKRDIFEKVGDLKGFTKTQKDIKGIKKELSKWDKGGYEPVEALDNEGLEKFAAKLEVQKFYNNPPASGAFGNARRALGIGLTPIINVSRRYGGHSGVRLAETLEDLGRTHSVRTGAAYRDLAEVFKSGPKGNWSKAQSLTSTSMEQVKGKFVPATKEIMKQREGVREGAALLTKAGIFDEVPKGLTPEFLRKASDDMSAALEAIAKSKRAKARPGILEELQKKLGPRGQDPKVVKLIDEINQHGAVSDHALRGLNDPRALELAPELRNYFLRNADRIGRFQDARGLGFMVQGTKGEAIPFSKAAEFYGDTYFPHMWNYDEMRRGSKSFEYFAKKLAREKGVSVEQARMQLEQRMALIPKRAQNIERARETLEAGYLLDPLEVLPRYAHNMEYRLAFAERFGVDGTGLNRLVDAVKAEKLLPNWYMDNIREMAFGRSKKDYGISRLINKMTGWQVLTKMGPSSTIANASQTINSAVIFGIRNAMKAMPRLYRTEGQKLAAGAYSKEVHKLLKAQAGVSSKSWANTWLEAVGFGPVERWNGFYSAVMGDTAATTLAAKIPGAGKQAPRMLAKLKQWGARESELEGIAKTGIIPYESRELIASKAVEMTQHAMRWEQMPMMWQNDFARIALQYKNFAYNQSRFIFREVVNPAVDYLASAGPLWMIPKAGRQGDIKPLLRMAPLFIGAGELVTHLRDVVKAAPRGVLTGDFEKKRDYFWESDDWALSMLRDTLMVGSAGMLGDLWESAERGKLPEWLLGPTLADVTELGTKAARAGRKAYVGEDLTKDFATFSNWAVRRAVPGLGPIVPSGVELEKAVEKIF